MDPAARNKWRKYLVLPEARDRRGFGRASGACCSKVVVLHVVPGRDFNGSTRMGAGTHFDYNGQGFYDDRMHQYRFRLSGVP